MAKKGNTSDVLSDILGKVMQGGFRVACGYTRDAEQECAAFFKRTGRIIKLLTVQEILDEEFVQKM